MKSLSLLVAILAISTPAAAKGLTVDDMLAMQRISDPAVSPDGKRVAFAVRDTDMDANKGRFDIWLANVDGTNVHRLTAAPENDTDPAWSADGKYVYFVSARGGSAQVWRIDPSTSGEAQQVTRLPLDVNGFKLFPDGKRVLVALDVWPAAKTLAESVKLDGEAAKRQTKTKARIYDHLLFRHWDQWEDGRFSHLFVWNAAKPDDAYDLTPGLETDTPSHPFGGMSDDVDVSPDGKRVAYVMRNSGRENAWHTNTDVFVVPDTGGKPTNVTAANQAYDFQPAFSPDGKWLALTQMKRPGYEADRARLSVVELATGKVRVLTEAWDASAGELVWAPDGKTIYTSSDHVGNHGIFAIDVASGKERLVIAKGSNTSPRVLPTGELLYLHDALDQPTEIYAAKLDGTGARAITHLNDARAKAIAWGATEQFSFTGAHGDKVFGYAIRPAGNDGHAKAPLAFLIHGGPQGSFDDHFHYRWNAQAFAGHGYGVVMIDFHGSTGYGQAFTDAINGDWGGAPYEDLMTGLDFAIKKYPWIDGSKVVALGASYGGYMINWINGHDEKKRFKALVCHDGNLDERMAYFDTEELWFPEWEHGGVPWDKPEGYLKHNPIDFVKNWQTPTLVIHGGLDYRVLEAHGMATFTALQRKGIPSKFIEFPDENHWVLKPQNSKLWHEEVLAWLDRWTKK